MSAISIKVLRVQHQDKQLLNQISLTIPTMSRVAIIGPNGAGKSTFLSAIMGLIHSEYARLSIYGQPLKSLTRKKIAQQIALIPQQQNIDSNITVKLWCEMARFPHQKWGFHLTDNESQLIDWALAETDTLQFKDRSLMSLSGGERQRVYIASALCQETPIIMLDEPNNFLDPKYVDAMNALIIRLAKEMKKTLLYVTHDLNSIREGFTHLLALKAGEVVFFDEVEQVFNQENLSALYDHQFRVAYQENGREVYF